jgi:hypothetical protein
MLVPRVQTKQTAKLLTVPAPIGGLNGRDSLAAMPPKDAFVLDNWIPGTATVDSRGGHAQFVSIANGPGGPIESLIPYVGGAVANKKLLAFGNGKIMDVTTSTPPAALQTGRTGNQIVHTMFSNAGAQFLIGVSGLDAPFSYDGTSIANLTITGLTGSQNTLSHVFSFKGRLYFCQKDMLGFYYLGVGNIQGAANYFDLAQVAKKGGYLVAMASFSADSGSGLNDYAVFITSEGEYIVYQGTDPSNVATWSLVARYYSAPPIGRRCAFNYGSELVILTQGGALPFSAIRSDGGVSEDDALTYKLGSYIQDKNLYAGVHGWQAALYPKKGLLFVNVPATGSIAGAYVQFVQNTKTKAWTRFTNLNGICWCEFNGDMYFGKYDGRVMKYDTGALDDNGPILLDCKQAYNYFEDGSGTTNSNKHFHFAKLLLGCDGDPPLNAQFNVDYVEDQPVYVAGIPDTTGALWDVATWDISAWGNDVTTKFYMVSMGKYGVAGSLWVRASLNGLSLKWYATQYVFSKAQGVL